MSHYYDLPEEEKTITLADLESRPVEFQIEVMRTWFFSNYQDPVHECPYNGREGGYQYIYGGPYIAGEELSEEFANIIDDDVIEKLASELEDECYEWSGVSRAENYDDYLFDLVGTVDNPHKDLLESIENLNSMISMDFDQKHQQTMLKMVFTSAITSLEAYLSEYFIGRIEKDSHCLRKFVETNTDFKKEKFSLSEIFARKESIEKYAKEYLVDLLWHNLPKIKPIFKKALDIEFPESIENLVKATHLRHDLVHRGGKSKEGKVILLHKNDVIELIAEILALAEHIEKAGTPEF
ncbi:HEPN domain-containing protein [Pseudoalteromonas distincta]|uniref:RiboL-PSP-HEPN domain-containing protein n=1 Tax=Pseudoalteromonas distincta TaxID=77608 RepID=A0A4V1HDE2_9GAMM|nr:HEPN domain-containing protein [Pseudoalteromonas distincta]QCU74465.1 hypothetical protein FFU37_08285 [Pseudoalteromonas distincta]